MALIPSGLSSVKACLASGDTFAISSNKTSKFVNGRLLAPHRIQPLPHALDFVDSADNESIVNDTSRFIPNAPPFDDVIEIDTFQQHNHPPNNQRRVNNNNINPMYDSCCD